MILQILIAFFVAMIPLIELRGSIPISVALGKDAPEWALLLAAMIGNILPVPVIYLFSKRVLNWGTNQTKVKWFQEFCNYCLKKGTKLGQKMLKRVKGGVYWALFLFVAIPIPGTGAWTGTLAATILNLDFKKTMVAVITGVIVAGSLMMAASLGFFRLILGQ